MLHKSKNHKNYWIWIETQHFVGKHLFIPVFKHQTQLPKPFIIATIYFNHISELQFQSFVDKNISLKINLLFFVLFIFQNKLELVSKGRLKHRYIHELIRTLKVHIGSFKSFSDLWKQWFLIYKEILNNDSHIKIWISS